MFVLREIVEQKLQQFLAEDIGEGDVTTSAVIPADLKINAVVVAKEDGVAAGIEEVCILAESVGLKAEAKMRDGGRITAKQVLMKISGDAQVILSVERTMLNLLSRMSGIATKTRALTEKLASLNVKVHVAATRKVAPGLLYFDKKAVIIGGADPHRLHLDDMVLIKDNHLAIIGSVEVAISRAKDNASFSKKIEVEVTSIEDALKAAKAGADIVMLDNFSPKQAKAASEMLDKSGFGGVLLEVSGGITGENILEYAKSDVDIISMGELTHSVKALDLSLEIIKS